MESTKFEVTKIAIKIAEFISFIFVPSNDKVVNMVESGLFLIYFYLN